MNIRKRNGSEVKFNRNNIIEAISRANEKVRLEDRLTIQEIKDIAKSIEDTCKVSPVAIGYKDIQKMVETAIMKACKYEVATEYITFRYQKALEERKNTIDDRVLSLLNGENEEIQQENANKNPNIVSTMRDYMAGEVSKDISQRYLIPSDIYDAHKEGIIHFHDMDYFAMPIHNCFGANETFITDTGIRKFCSFSKDGEQTYVKDKDGNFRLATVRCYGEQPCNEVTLTTRTGFKKKVIVTANHRWLLENGEITTNLKEGDFLALTNNSTNYDIKTPEDAKAWCIGFIVGDGCDHYNYTQARLCGYKSKYLSIFEKAGFVIHNYDGEPLPMTKFFSKQDFLNGHAWRYMTPEHKALVFKGFYAADGNQDRNSIGTNDERIETMIEELAGFAGYYIMSKKHNVRTTNMKENAELTTYKFLTETKHGYGWKVASIKPYQNGKPKQVWCVEEPVTHTFTLSNGVVTGNCCLINLDDMLQNGTIISGTQIDKPHTFRNACNIASQIVAQVASSQYGGQTITASHLSKFINVAREYFKKEYPTLNEAQIEDLVKKDIRDGVQTLQYQILTLQTTNGQTPFVSVCLYLNEAENEEEKENLALVIEEILKQRIKGVKNENGQYYANPFPKLLYVLEEDNIHEGDKYYYLTKLAAECTTKRMVPDYISEKVMKKLKVSKKGEEGDCYPCMGCVSGDSVVRIKENDNETKFITMEELWTNYAKNIKHQFTEDNPNLYSLVDNLKIFDNKLGDYTTCKMINKNINNNWVLLKLESDTEKCEIKCTDNHIWTTVEGIDKTAKELSLNDKLYYSISVNKLVEMNIESIIYIQDDKPSYDVTTETEHFEVNGLYSHNCRSFLTPYRQPKHDETLTFTEDVDLEIES